MIARRRLLWLPLALVPSCLHPYRPYAPPPPPSPQLDLSQFVAEAQPIARALVEDRTPAGEDRYLYRLAALAVRLGRVPARPLFPLGAVAPGVTLAPAFRGVPFFVIEWRLAPGARFPAHDHPGYSVCTVGIEGEAIIDHLDLQLDERDPNAVATVRRTRTVLLERGRVDTLAPTRDNIHQLRAGRQGARGLDITTLHADADHGFHWVDVPDPAAGLGVPVSARLRPAQRR